MAQQVPQSQDFFPLIEINGQFTICFFFSSVSCFFVVVFCFLFLSGLCWRTLQVSLQINFLIEVLS
jgi:hypothetical protein